MRFLAGSVVVLALVAVSSAAGADRVVRVFEDAVIQWNPDVPVEPGRAGHVSWFEGQLIDRRVELPPPAPSPGLAPRIIGRVEVEPIHEEGERFPNDMWTRLGKVSILLPRGNQPPIEVALMRFVTGYGGAGVFEQDLTAFAPLLAGERTIRAGISSFSEGPGWRLSLTLSYSSEPAGSRRPALALPLFHNEHVTAEFNRLTAEIAIPPGVAEPRIRITSTGHCTDGLGGNEFVTSVHLLKVDGHEVAKWRPWVEGSTLLRPLSPWAGRSRAGGREIWACDFDRSGWQPGLAVEPTTIPAPELTPGSHTVELVLRGIRRADPEDQDGHHGYWVVDAVILADEPESEGDEGDR